MNLKNIVMTDLSIQEQEDLAKKHKLTKKDFETVYNAYHQRIFNFINSRVTNSQDAEDITSLVFERVMKKLEDFRWQGITITSWIYRIARNAIIDYYRKYSERNRDSSIERVGDFLVSHEEKIEEIMISDEEVKGLYKSIKYLKEEDQFLIYYKFFEEMSNKEISEATGLSETNVGTKLHRIRQKLAKLIKKSTKN